MPPHLRLAGAVGPSLPPHLQHSLPSDGQSDSEPVQLPVRPPAGQSDSDDDFGPSLPPSLGPAVKGPTMPSRGQPFPASYNVQDISDSDDDEPMVGPMPPGYQSQEQSEEHILAEFNRREERMKLKLSGVDVDGERKLEREEWMTELPSLRANMISGNQIVGATTFRKNGVVAAEAGRSEWTKTPNQGQNLNSRERKIEDQKRIDYMADHAKNQRQEKILAKQKRDSESLMNTHQKKMRKKEKEERNLPGYKKERVAFDKEKDMQGSIIDDAKRKQLLKKQMGLDNRFGAGNSKFL